MSLYEQHEITRHREGLTHLNPSSDPLRTELTTGKFTILVSIWSDLVTKSGIISWEKELCFVGMVIRGGRLMAKIGTIKWKKYSEVNFDAKRARLTGALLVSNIPLGI